ncbi:hypothetical protein DNTS_024389 [Danionella cerebrum]|uniref:V-type proton ATPase subunit C n=1 Tax=Danionella cerebrum TaxID=2873325 RepID=A0A553RKD6_9TELE|nr:hypothetical protein DNTS_024389 [Danionella translucida]
MLVCLGNPISQALFSHQNKGYTGSHLRAVERRSRGMEFWIISVPLDKTSSQSLEELRLVTAKSGTASWSRFHIPDLKVGTLDVLLGLSDDLSQLDSFTEGVFGRSCQSWSELMEESAGNLQQSQNLKAEDLATHLNMFQWDRAKYPPVQPLKILTEIISKQVSLVDVELKSRRASFSQMKSRHRAFERKTEGRLQSHALSNIVRKEDLVLNSDYLVTLLVVVPRAAYTVWETTYESLSKFVVPRSSQKLAEDAEAGIFTVTLFKKVCAEFTANAKKHKFTVREYNPDEAEKQKQEMQQLASEKKELCRALKCWLKLNLSEIFVAWVHIKVLRTFIESVLRYGLPVNFQTLLLQPRQKRRNQLKQQLSSLFQHLEPAATVSKQEVLLDSSDGNSILQEHDSYICFPIRIQELDPR